MISRIKGTLWEASALRAVINVGGVGYDVSLPLSVSEGLPAIGVEVELYIYSVYREDSATLYGFWDASERAFFRMLIEKVSGIGPKMALALLSRSSVAHLRAAIDAGDVATLSATPGIGKKTAERLILELRGHLQKTQTGASGVSEGSSPSQDAIGALTSLGYSAVESAKSVKRVLDANAEIAANLTADEIIKLALKK